MTTRPGSGGTWLRRWTGCPGIAERAGPLLGPPAPPSFEGLVTALINGLAAQPAIGGSHRYVLDYQAPRSIVQAFDAGHSLVGSGLPGSVVGAAFDRASNHVALVTMLAVGQRERYQLMVS
jgi:LuxR family maltose regulon positive regulatory protein